MEAEKSRTSHGLNWEVMTGGTTARKIVPDLKEFITLRRERQVKCDLHCGRDKTENPIFT